MSGETEPAAQSAQWAAKADNDIRNAEYTLTLEVGCPFDTICFHAQQCVEKYLKALLLHASSDAPRTHDLRLLLQRLPSEFAEDFRMEDMVDLNRYSVESRYPGEWEPISRDEAERAVSLARAVRAAARRLLSQ
ncbi:MAG TPA: HEPN domain-containing protein [Candidatus Solibacter sp.]|nr:HEPN domain-containing protein [Candidatus Solibacter sp.]